METTPSPISPNGHTSSHPVAPARAGHLLDREAPAEYRRDWTVRISQSKDAAAGTSVSALVFRLGEEWLALPTHVLQEVVRGFTVRTIPHRRNGTLLGIVNVRGELLLCVSLGATIGSSQADSNSKASPDGKQRLLVLRHQEMHLAFPVDEVIGVHRYRPDELLEAPATVARDGKGFTRSLFALEGRTVGCLDVDAVLGVLESTLG